jgi:uncharacterized protein (TIGR02466 family)
MPIHNLFPIPIGRYELDRKITSKELSFVKKQKKRPNMGNKTSEDNKILENKELFDIKSFIIKSVDEYFKTVYDPKNDVDLRITQSWCNYSDKNEWHHKHNHPNSFISGVFYFQSNKQTDKIHFYNEKYEMVKLSPNNWNLWNSESWWFDVGSGELLLFPSSLSHMVEPVESNQTRISLSFNTFIVGKIGNIYDLAYLNIEGVST